MSKKSQRIKESAIKILQDAHTSITTNDFSEYAQNTNTTSYFVYQDTVRVFEMNIEPARFGMCAYTIIMNNGEKLSCKARPNAIFLRRPIADDMLDVYNEIKLRLLIQNSRRTK